MNRIVISSNTCWSIYNFRLDLIKILKEKGYKVVIVAPYDEYSKKLDKEFEYYNIFINNKGTNPVEDIRTFFEYYKLYKKLSPKIVIHYTIKPNIYGSLAAKLLNIKIINNVTGLGTLFIRETFSTKIAKFLYKISLCCANKIFFQNKDDFEFFIKNELVNEKRCSVLLGRGIDVEKFKPINFDKKDNIFRFLLIARMIWDKGIKEYVEAAKIIKEKYKNVEFLLLGPTNIKNPTAIPIDVIKHWEEMGLVKYLGETDDVREEIAKVDCVVLPSYREGISNVLLEGAAMAKPLIATNVPGCKEVIEDGVNGFLCKVKDVTDLASKMEKILNLKEEDRKKMGLKGREKVIEKFNSKIIISKYLKIIEDLLKN